jgi:hypothetical protein
MQANMLHCSKAAAAAAPTAGWQRQVPKARQCACANKRTSSDGPVIDKEFEMPKVGWMWDPSGAKSHTTERRLKAANIKAKRCVSMSLYVFTTTVPT